jgi:hypothetical protein
MTGVGEEQGDSHFFRGKSKKLLQKATKTYSSAFIQPPSTGMELAVM